MMKPKERRQLKATQVFDLEDAFARARRIKGLHPRPFGTINFAIVAQIGDGRMREDLVQPLKLITVQNPGGYHLFFGEYQLPDGLRRHNILADGQYVVRVEAHYYQPVEQNIILPMPDPHTPVFIELEPGYAYPFPKITGHLPTLLYGKVQNPDGEGLARVSVSVAGEAMRYWTDKAGQWVLNFPESWQTSSVDLRFTLPDGSSQSLDDIEVIADQTNSVPPVTLPG